MSERSTKLAANRAKPSRATRPAERVSPPTRARRGDPAQASRIAGKFGLHHEAGSASPHSPPLDAIARQIVSDQETAGGGEPLPASIRGTAEMALGTDLGRIRLHHDDYASWLTRALGAEAAQIREHVFVRPDLFDPQGARGRSLLGHELVHAAQHVRHGTTGAALSHPSQSAETEAARLGPQVLRPARRAAAQVPRVAPSARIHRQPAAVDEQIASLPAEICDPDTWDGNVNVSGDPGIDTRSTSDDPGSGEASGVSYDPLDRGNMSFDPTAGEVMTPDPVNHSIDPSLIDVRGMTNRELIQQGIDARQIISGFSETNAETEAWAQLDREVEDERAIRVSSGFVFMADARDAVPEQLFELVAGALPGSTAIYVAFPEVALGPVDVSILGIILTQTQLEAYLESAGMMEPSSEAATRALEILQSGDTGQFTEEFAPATPEPTHYGPNFIYSRQNRNPLANEMVTVGNMPEWLMPLHEPSNIIGHMGEASFFFGPEAGFGRGAINLNDPSRTWTDIRGRPQSRNAPVADFLLQQGQGQLPYEGRPISNAATAQMDQASATRFLMDKMGQMLDVEGRRLEGISASDDSATMAETHVREMAGDANLAAGTPEFAAAQRRFLGDTMFAVPAESLARIRGALRQPYAVPSGGNAPAMTVGYRALYDQILREAPIPSTRKNGQSVTISSFADLVSVLPNSYRSAAKGDPIVPGGPGQQALSEGRRTEVLKLLGRMAEARVISRDNVQDMIASSDILRGVGEAGSIAEETRILSTNRQNLSDTGRRMRDALGDARTAEGPGEFSWTTRATRARGDRYLSALRSLTNNPDLQRSNPDGTPNAEFTRLRAQLTQEIVLAIPEGQRGPLIEAVATSQSDLAIEIRAALQSDIPTVDAEAIRVVLGDATTAYGIDSPTLGRSAEYFSGVESRRQLSPDDLTLAQQPSWGRGAAGRLPGNIGRNLWGNALGYAVTAGADAATGREVHLPGLGQVGVDLGIGLASEEIERVMAARMASSRLFSRLPVTSAVGRGVLQKAAPGFIIQPVVSVGMGEYAMAQDRELYDQLGIEMTDQEVSSRRAHNLGVGVVGAGASALVIYTAAGAVGGPPGMLVGFLIGAASIAAGALAGYAADRLIPNSREDWIERHRRDLEARAAAERQRAEEIRQGLRPVQSFEAGQVPIPYRASRRISPEVQSAIAQSFIANSRLSEYPIDLPTEIYGPPLPEGYPISGQAGP